MSYQEFLSFERRGAVGIVRLARPEGAGPYRASGREAAHATRSWKVDAHELAETLRRRALGLAFWGMASALWAMV